MEFSDEQLNRYSRHLILKSFGGKSQEKMLRSSVLVVGAGGLGSAVLLYLASCGVGKIGIVDFDTVEESNLPRQIIHDTASIGRLKTDSAEEKLRKLNPDVQIVVFKEKLMEENVSSLIKDFDLIVDGLDTFNDKFLLNDYAVKLKKSFIHGGALGYEGQVMTVIPNKSACLRCLFPVPPEDYMQTCSEVGVLSTCVGLISMLQANEAVKLLTGLGELYTNRVIKFDSLKGSFYELKIEGKNKNCPLCSQVVKA